MKPKQLFGILLLLVGAILSGCRNTPDFPGFPDYPYVTHEYQIYIDSTASACGIDSCAINLPWLNEKINAFLADSIQRKNNLVSSLDIDKIIYTYPDSPEEYTCFKYVCSDDTLDRILWLGCESDTIYVWEYYEIETDSTVLIFPDTDFENALHIDSVLSEEKIVDVHIGFIPIV